MSETVHLHARYGDPMGGCETECGIACDAEPVAYRGLNPERVTCPTCLTARP